MMMTLKEKLSLWELEWCPSVGGTVPEGRGSNLRNIHPGCAWDTEVQVLDHRDVTKRANRQKKKKKKSFK